MKKLRPFLLVSAIIAWAMILVKCSNAPDKSPDEMKFSAGITPSYFIDKATGDTIYLKDSIITNSYTTTFKIVRHFIPKDTIVNPPGNIPPTANAGPDKILQLPTNKIFFVGDGGDVDGQFTVQWSKVSGAGVIVNGTTLVNASLEQLTTPGVTVLRLIVTDDKGAKATDDMTVTVIAAPVDPGTGSTTSFNVAQIPFSDPDLNAPGRGAEQWHSQNTVNIPSEGTNTQRLDVYFRTTWWKLEPTKDAYNWSYFDSQINTAINKRQKVSFGIMSVYHDNEPDIVTTYDNGRSSYPQYLHALMQAESVKDWKTNMAENAAPTTGFGGWVPNYNSSNYLNRLRALNTAIYNHIMTTSFNGVRYQDVINSIDVRGYGNYGEWHNAGIVTTAGQEPTGTRATVATLKSIIDAHTQTIPTIQLNIIMTAFDADWLNHTKTPTEVAYYALTTRNTYGPLGWRRDNWGATDDYIKDLLERNTRSFNGVALNTLIMARWQTAPITGEPMNSTSNEFADFERQVRLYHGASFGNGNITTSPGATVKNNFRAASKAAGYRLSISSGSITTGAAGKITLNWQNTGIAPTYENWNTVFELKSGSTVVWTGTSKFKAKLFLPTTAPVAVVDDFPNIPVGNYTLTVKLVDPTGYRAPLVMAIKAKNADGSYTLK
ncbi:MAG: hypothetical protein ABI675_19400 [Chitinophagaceae bacterium]